METKDGIKGKTAFQKIIEKHLERLLPGGSMVLQVDMFFGHEITTPNAIMDMHERGLNIVINPNRVKLMTDHVYPPKDTASAIQSKIIRLFSEEHAIEYLREGVCHAMIPEKGWIFPGQIVVMSDSHTCTLSAFGPFAAGVGTTELEAAIMTGYWTCPSQKVIRVNFVGKLPANVFAKDLILELIKRIGVKGATNCVIEFGGSVIKNISMDARMTISNMSVECGATSGMMPIDRKTIKYLWPALLKKYGKNANPEQVLRDLQRFNSDLDAEYDRIIEINVSDMVPVTTVGFLPENVVSVSSIGGTKVDQVFIGSCTNGRFEDLVIAASVFQQMGGKVPNNVCCIIIPATDYVYDRALDLGLIKIFRKAGCVVCNSSCGPCLGMSCGVQPPKGVCASTSNRNFENRMGKGAMVHLVSPATAAITALTGVITEPSVAICEQALKYLKKANSSHIEAVKLTDWEDKPFKTPDFISIAAGIKESQRPDFSGKAFYLPQKNVDTDQIIPAESLNITDKKELGKHCLESVPMSEKDRVKFSEARIIVADENFGSGSSREHAPWALANAGAGIKCVIAPSFARIFENNMFANGYIAITLPKEIIDLLLKEKPEEISVDWENGIVEWNDGHKAKFEISEYRKDLIKSGGLVGVMLKLAAELQKEGKI